MSNIIIMYLIQQSRVIGREILDVMNYICIVFVTFIMSCLEDIGTNRIVIYSEYYQYSRMNTLVLHINFQVITCKWDIYTSTYNKHITTVKWQLEHYRYLAGLCVRPIYLISVVKICPRRNFCDFNKFLLKRSLATCSPIAPGGR